MNIIQFLRILWAHRMLTLVSTGATLVGALLAILIIPPSYEAKTRVMLNLLKPDPVTNTIMPGGETRTFIATQAELIKDYGVAGQAVDKLGWTSNPDTIEEYSKQSNPDGDLRRWLSREIMERTRVTSVPGTNILEISFKSATPAEASSMANALRDAYIESSLSSRRRDAMRNADWYTQQADREKSLLDASDATKTAYERENGIVMQDDKTDVETARLRALSGQSSAMVSPIMMPAAAATASPAAIQLAQLDAQMAQMSQNLGENHPAMIELKARRSTLAKLVASDQAAANAALAVAAAQNGSRAGRLNQEVASQTARVIASRDKIEKLTQLQADVNLHRDQMQKSLARATELRQEAAVADPGVTVLSEAVSPRKPAFPQIPLIIGGGLVFGAAAGLLLSLIVEFLNRRVRGVEDLKNSLDIPVLAVITRYPAAAGRVTNQPQFVRRWLVRHRRPSTA